MIKRIIDVISAYVDLPINQISEESNVFDLGVDSLRMLKIIMEIEEIYGVRFDDKEIVDLRCAFDIEKIILEKIK